MGNESENELTRVEIVLHNFNRAAIDTFLKTHGFETDSDDWGTKIKKILLVIDEVQRNVRNEQKCAKK